MYKVCTLLSSSNFITFNVYFHGLLQFYRTLGLIVASEKSQNYPCFVGIFDPTQCNRHKLRTSTKRVSLLMFNFLSVSYFPSVFEKKAENHVTLTWKLPWKSCSTTHLLFLSFNPNILKAFPKLFPPIWSLLAKCSAKKQVLSEDICLLAMNSTYKKRSNVPTTIKYVQSKVLWEPNFHQKPHACKTKPFITVVMLCSDF